MHEQLHPQELVQRQNEAYQSLATGILAHAARTNLPISNYMLRQDTFIRLNPETTIPLIWEVIPLQFDEQQRYPGMLFMTIRHNDAPLAIAQAQYIWGRPLFSPHARVRPQRTYSEERLVPGGIIEFTQDKVLNLISNLGFSLQNPRTMGDMEFTL